MMMITRILRSDYVLKLRSKIAGFRARYDVFYRLKLLSIRLSEIEGNICYEANSSSAWFPKVLELDQTLRKVIDEKCSLARYGDGEFELMAGRNMSFEFANSEMALRLKNILANPDPRCLNCVPNVFASLGRYRTSEANLWRKAALWMRPILRETAKDQVFGDTQTSRPYLGVGNGERAEEIFGLWKELFSRKDVLIVEGRFSRLGVGNDLFEGAKSIKRIWCPAKGAYAKYDEIKEAVLKYATKDTLIVMALGATATILAYDLAKLGYWAVDAGHVDVEYMWMKIGAKDKVAIPGKYVNEAIGGHEMVAVNDEVERLNVVYCIK